MKGSSHNWLWSESRWHGFAHSQPTSLVTATSITERLTTTQDMLNLAGLHVRMNTQTRFLLHHCMYISDSIASEGMWLIGLLVLYHRSKSLCTVTVETGWLTYALKDPGLFHSTLYHWALLNGDMTPVTFRQTDQLLKVKQIAIRSINERLRSQDISDEVVASVTCLASVNVSIFIPGWTRLLRC